MQILLSKTDVLKKVKYLKRTILTDNSLIRRAKLKLVCSTVKKLIQPSFWQLISFLSNSDASQNLKISET